MKAHLNSRRVWLPSLGAMALALLIGLVAGAASHDAHAQTPGAHGLERAITVQERHTDALLNRPGVVGTGVTLVNGQPAIKLYLERAVPGLPQALDNIPVIFEVTGEIVALHHQCGHTHPVFGPGECVDDPPGEEPPPPPDNGSTFNPKARAGRPVPIGVSASNQYSIDRGFCYTGTLGARLKAGDGKLYALSNNHVFANENGKNGAIAGSKIVQPGLADNGCQAMASENGVATLTKWVPITFSRNASNRVDAAIALVDSGAVGNSTPASVSYGTPSSAPATATNGMAVQKYGRTTGHTEGAVTAINVTIVVKYNSGQARFVGQIEVKSASGNFSAGGDSGSLIVTKSGNQPVGLLFAGGGSSTFANPIGDVLSQLAVTGLQVDGN